MCRQKPQDKEARAKLTECDKQIKRIMFEEAIAAETERLPSLRTDPESYGTVVLDVRSQPRFIVPGGRTRSRIRCRIAEHER